MINNNFFFFEKHKRSNIQGFLINNKLMVLNNTLGSTKLKRCLFTEESVVLI